MENWSNQTRLDDSWVELIGNDIPLYKQSQNVPNIIVLANLARFEFHMPIKKTLDIKSIFVVDYIVLNDYLLVMPWIPANLP